MTDEIAGLLEEWRLRFPCECDENFKSSSEGRDYPCTFHDVLPDFARKLLQGRDAEIVQTVALADRLAEALAAARECVDYGPGSTMAQVDAAVIAADEALTAWRESRKAP